MNNLEQTPQFSTMPDFGMTTFDMNEEFDINAAFQEAVHGVATDNELVLEEKVRRMGVIVSEGTSEVYRDFVDFRAIAAQMEMMCNHDHAMNESLKSNALLSKFMDGNKSDHDHDHGKDSEYEIDSKTGKKIRKKKRYGWFSLLLE